MWKYRSSVVFKDKTKDLSSKGAYGRKVRLMIFIHLLNLFKNYFIYSFDFSAIKYCVNKFSENNPYILIFIINFLPR